MVSIVNGIDFKKWTSEQAGEQAQVTYEKYKKIKSFQDVGYLLTYYVVSGGEVSKNIKRNDVIDVTDIVASLDDNIMSRDGTSFKTDIPDTTYFLDFDKTGDWQWGTTHSPGEAGVDYLTIAEVMTNAAGMVSVISDKRGHVGGMRLKDEFGLEDYALKEVVAQQLADKAKQSDLDNLNSEVVTKAEKSYVNNTKRDKSIPIGLSDIDSELLAAIQGGEGTSFDLLSIPQKSSVSYEKLDNGIDGLITRGKNLLNVNDPYFLQGYAIGTSGNPVVAAGYYITGFIPVYEGDSIKLSTDGTQRNWNSIASYDSNKTYVGGSYSGAGSAYTVPPGSFYIRLSALEAVLKNEKVQIEIGGIATSYEPYGYNVNSLNVEEIKKSLGSFLTDVPNESVTFEKLHNGIDGLITKNKNLLNITDPDFKEGYVIGSNGAPFASAGYYITGFIPVSAGDSITLSIMGDRKSWNTIASYTADKVFITGSRGTTGNVYTVPSGAAFIRMARVSLNEVGAQIEIGSEATPYEPFGYKIHAMNTGDVEVPDGSVTYEKLHNGIDGLIIRGKNLLNKTDPDFREGYVIGGTGNVVVAEDKYASGFIPVVEGNSIVFSVDGIRKVWYSIASYDGNKVFVAGSRQGSGNKYTVPSGAAFIRVSSGDLNDEKAQLEIGDAATDFEAYGYRVNAVNVSDSPVNPTNPTSLPKYMSDEIDRIENVVIPQDGILKFAFCPDTHIYSENYVKVQQVAELNKLGYLDFICDGGDLLDGKGADPITGLSRKPLALKLLKNAAKTLKTANCDVYFCRGNHDTNFYNWSTLGDATIINKVEWYNTCVGHLTNNEKVVFDDANPFGGYYYADYDRAKIRVIFLNTSDVLDDTGHALCDPVYSDIQQTQFDWFCNKALDFMDKGEDRSNWAVMLLSHACVTNGTGGVIHTGITYDNIVKRNTENFIGVIKAFMDGSTFSLTTNLGNDFQLMSNVNYTSQGAMEYICSINGHAHFDVVKVDPTLNRPNIQTINMQCVQKGKGGGEGGTDTYPTTGDIYTVITPYRPTGLAGDGTIHSEALDVYSIDRTNRKIRVTRYGAGVDREISY